MRRLLRIHKREEVETGPRKRAFERRLDLWRKSPRSYAEDERERGWSLRYIHLFNQRLLRVCAGHCAECRERGPTGNSLGWLEVGTQGWNSSGKLLRDI